MPTIVTHTFVALAFGRTCYTPEQRMPARFWTLSVLLSVLPDLDVVGFALGIRYSDLLGHRGLFHSLPFALVVSLAVVTLGFRSIPRFSRGWWALLAYFFALAASHGLLDAMTDGGLGIALFSPFDETRYFFPWQPIRVSPIGLQRVLTHRGWVVFKSELLWVWVPAAALLVAAGTVRLLKRRVFDR